MSTGIAQTEDIGEYSYGPAEQGSEVSGRSMWEVGHGIEEEPLQVDDRAVGQHHMIPGIGLAAEDYAAARKDPVPGHNAAQIK